ncbi:hypothetical protein ACQ4PT_016044 [Festuca glaucescens]
MATAAPEPLSSGQEGDEDEEVRVDEQHPEQSDQALKERLQRIQYGLNKFNPRDGGKKYRLLRDSINRELARRQAARSASGSPQPRPPRPQGRQGEPQGELDGRFADAEEKPSAPAEEPAEVEEEEEGDEDEDWSDDEDVREAHAWLDTAESPDGSTLLSATFSGAGGVARRPNAHGGMLARTLQPLSNRQQKLASHFRAGPLEGHLYIIDISQSVDLDHPLALDFLKEDCLHVYDFFEKRGVAVMTVTELFNFVVDQKIADEDVDDYLEKVQQKITEKRDRDAEDDEIAPTVLVQTLDYVKQCEADIVNMSVAQRPSLGYEPTADKLYDLPQLGFVRAKKEPSEQQQEEAAQDTLEEPLDLQNKCSLEDNKEEDESDDNESCSGSDEDGWRQESTKLGPKEKKAARKENKKKVKEEKRETRKMKIHKADKKRKKMAKAKCKR